MNHALARPITEPRAPSQPPDAAMTVLWLILGVCGWVFMGSLFLDAMRPSANRVNDFYQDWGSARNHQVGVAIYSHHGVSIPRHLGIAFDPAAGVDYNAHPPTTVLLTLPFAALDYRDAVLAWNSLSLTAFLISLLITARILTAPAWLWTPVLAVLPFCHPLYGSLFQGQLTLILVFLVTATWALDRSGRSDLAAIVLGTAAAIKLFPAFLLLIPAAQGRIRPILVTLATLLGLSALAAWILGVDAYRDYFQIVLPAQTRFRSLGYNYAIAGLWHKLFDPAGEHGLTTALLVSPATAQLGTLCTDLAITLLAFLTLRNARDVHESDRAFGVVVTAMLLVSPVTWDASLPLLMTPVAILAAAVGASPRWRWMLIGILAVVWMPQQLLTRAALLNHATPVATWAFMMGAPSIKTYALIAIFALGVTSARWKSASE